MNAWLPQNASSYGAEVDGVIGLIFTIVGIWFLIALSALVGFAVVFRHKEGRRAAYIPAHGFRQTAFVIVPALLVLGFDLAIDAVSTRVWDEIKIGAPPADQTVGVSASQFVWKFAHPGRDGALGTPDDVSLENNLHVPVDAVVHFELAATDVIHSFFIPNFRIKQDAVPGRTFTGWFRATRPGRYQIVCAELCGIGHTNMRGWIHVHTPEEFETWLATESPAPDAATAESAPQKNAPPEGAP